MSTTTLSQRLRDLRNGLFPDIETVNAVLDDCIAQAEAQEAQAIGEQTPVASAPVCMGCFSQEAVCRQPGLCVSGRPKWIPSGVSPEARDRAIEALDLSKEALPYAYDDRNGNTVTPWNLEVTRAIKKIDQAISALRG